MVERFAGLLLNKNKRDGPSPYDREPLTVPRFSYSSFFLNWFAPISLQQVDGSGVSNTDLMLYRRLPIHATDETELTRRVGPSTTTLFVMPNDPRHVTSRLRVTGASG